MTKKDYYIRKTSTNYSAKKGACKSLSTFIYDKKNRKSKHLFACIRDFDKYSAEKLGALQTSCGLNHFRRDKIVIDRDRDKNEQEIRSLAYRLEEFKEKITDKTNITYSAYTYNTEKGTIQFTIYLSNPIIFDQSYTAHDDYKKITSVLNMLNGDPGFTGWQCRNPFFTGNSKYSTYVSAKTYTKKDLLAACKLLLCESKSTCENDMSKKKKKGLKKGGKQELELKFCREYYKKNKNTCTEESMISALWEEETQIALHTNTEKHDYSEVESRAKACFRWCKENFGTSKIWQHKNEKAHLKRQKNIEIVKVYKSAGLKQKEIAKKLGLSIAAVKKYYSEIKKDTNLTFDDIAWKYEHISKGRKFYETEEDRIEETGDSIEEKDRRKNDAERIFDLRLFPTFQRKDNDCTRVCASDTVLEEHGLCTDWDYEIFADKWVRSKFLGKEDA